ncbi:MAG: signal peptidase II [Spirochaetes bacterium]|nr:MAG: signal peptidase II [Spirochaetota bacterium]RLA90581.1 MAG: signal peptidase II [Deltaproteobacteria bacterium]
MKKKYWILILTILPILLFDQGSKKVIREKVMINHSITIIEGYFNIVHIENPGAVFGFLSDKDKKVKNIFLFISIFAILFIIYLFLKIQEKNALLPFCLSLVLGGAAGNLIDRIRFGMVTDFLDFHWHNHHWPAFNIADSAITIGMIMLILYMLEEEIKRRKD